MTEPWQRDELAEVSANIKELQAALRDCGPGHPEHGMLRNFLGICRMVRFSITGERADLDAAILDLEAAVSGFPRGNPDRAMALASLASALTDRFQRADRFPDVEAAISAAQAAADTAPAGHEARLHGLLALGGALQARYQRTGVLDDLNASISHLQAAAGTVEEGWDGRGAALSNLGMSLRVRFERTSDPADLEAAIVAGQAAVAAYPPDHPDRESCLSNLGLAFTRRFMHAGALADLNDAIKALHAAAKVMSPGNPDRAGVHSNLAVALLNRYQRTGDLADLDDAVSVSQVAVNTSSHSDQRRAGMVSTTAIALFSRYERTRDPADLDAAIGVARASVDAVPADHPEYSACLTNLGRFLHTRFQRTGDPADLDGAIRATYQAWDATPASHAERAIAVGNVGVVLRSRFRLTGLPSDRDAALAYFVQASEATSAPPSFRARVSVAAGLLAEDAGDLAQAARLLEAAVRWLPKVAPRQRARGDQQYAIAVFDGLGGAAASAAMADPSAPEQERPARALALLEASRATLLSQALDTREDLTDLRAAHPDLADRFVGLRDRLDQPEGAVVLTGEPLAGLGRATEDREQVAEEFARTLREIQALEKHARFGLPPSIDELRAEAAEGPVVTFTVSSAGSGALLLTTGGISYLDLPGLTDDALTRQVNAFHGALRDTDSDGRQTMEDARHTLTATLEWLWDTTMGPVLDALGYLARPASGRLPRVWWVPGGKLGLLPIHAAGYHAEQSGVGESARSVLDAVISSYTPTVRALRYARQQARHRDGTARALVVAMPVTPGQMPLPGAADEIAEVCAMLPGPVVLAGPTDDAQPDSRDNLPTKANVLRHLPACSIAHFACHADSDPVDPSRSMLLLSDYESAPLTVAALAPVDHERLELTYLSACSTAFTAATELADEAIHLTSAFQLAGSRHVIGTLWPVDDLVSRRVATAFYEGLRGADGAVDTDRAAVALHEAVRAMRRRWTIDPSRWAPYLHAGA